MRWHPSVRSHGDPLLLGRWRVGLELHQQLLCTVHQPPLSSGLHWGFWAGSIAVRHVQQSDHTLLRRITRPNGGLIRSWCDSTLRTASVADPEELQRVKDQLEVVRLRSLHVHFMNRALLQGLRGAAAHTGEMVRITIDRCVERFACRQMPAAHLALLMEFAQIAIDGCKPHGARLPFQAAMQLLAGHFGLTLLQFLQQQLLPLRACGSLLLHAEI